MKTKIHIIVASVDNADRREVENIENCTFNNEDEIRALFENEIEIYPLDFFTEECNNENVDIDGSWIGYVTILN